MFPLRFIENLFIFTYNEFLGLLFLVSFIFFYIKSKKINSNKKSYLFFSGFFLSLSITTHPIFLFLNFFLVPLILFRTFRSDIIPFLLGTIIPVIFFLFFYYKHFPTSTDQLFMISGGFPYFGYFVISQGNFRGRGQILSGKDYIKEVPPRLTPPCSCY